LNTIDTIETELSYCHLDTLISTPYESLYSNASAGFSFVSIIESTDIKDNRWFSKVAPKYNFFLIFIDKN